MATHDRFLITDMHKQIASFALALLPRATVPANESDLKQAIALTQWLKAIISGDLVVSEKQKEQANAV